MRSRWLMLLLVLSVASPTYGQAPLRPAGQGRTRDRRQERDRRRPRCRHQGRQDRRGRADHPGSQAAKTIDASGLYVTPGLVDIHVHVYTGEGESYSRGFRSVPPDGFTLESCTTSVADAGSSGWRNFDDFKKRIIDQSKTRVTGVPQHRRPRHGRGPIEQDLADMEAKPPPRWRSSTKA